MDDKGRTATLAPICSHIVQHVSTCSNTSTVGRALVLFARHLQCGITVLLMQETSSSSNVPAVDSMMVFDIR